MSNWNGSQSFYSQTGMIHKVWTVKLEWFMRLGQQGTSNWNGSQGLNSQTGMLHEV